MSSGSSTSNGNNHSHHHSDQKLVEENNVLKNDLNTMKKQISDLQRRFEKEQSREVHETIQLEQKKAIKTYVVQYIVIS